MLVGRSDETHRLWDRVLACADDARPVLVLGPPGSGEQAIARTLHRVGRRADGPLVRVDCATPSELESLGAAIDEARGGTLLLAPADCAPGAEDALAKAWAPQDGAAPRVIATAERAPETAPGRAFWARFDTHRLDLSPLAMRPDDVAVLAEYFLDEIFRSLGVRKRWLCCARPPRAGAVARQRARAEAVLSRAVLDAPTGLAEAGVALPAG